MCEGAHLQGVARRMDWFDTILSPIMWVVAWIMVLAHKGFTALGMSPQGMSWVLSIVVLVIVFVLWLKLGRRSRRYGSRGGKRRQQRAYRGRRRW